MFNKIGAAKAAGKLSSVAAAAAALLAAGWSETVQAETLASWELTSNASDTPIQEAETKALAISTAILTKGDGVIATPTAGFGGKDYEEGTDLVSALSSNNFLQISLTIAQCYTVSLQSIEYTLYRSKDTGPTFFQWVCFTNEIECAPIDVPVNFTANASNKRFTTDLSSLPILPPNTIVALRLAAWEATKDSGTFLLRADNSKTDIIISGTSEREVSDELTLDPISDGAVNCGEEPFVARLGIFGDSGTGVTTNVTTSAAITGTTNLVNGVFTYAPTKADAALSPITFTATVTKDGESPVSQFFDVTVNVIPPAIGEIAAQQCYAGDTNIVALTLSGDYAEAGETVSTNAICQTYITGQFSTNITNGVFWYAPSVEDLTIAEENEGVIGFKVVLTVGDLAATNEFTVAVSEKPDFFEGFETYKYNNYYKTPTPVQQDAAMWQGTNFCMNISTANDLHNGTNAVVFQKSSGYIEMTTDKANGAGSISFWHGIRANDAQSATASFVVKVSNNGGITWTAYVSDPIASSHNFSKSTLENVNVGGSVRVKFEVTCSHHVSVDDIIITDYEGQAEIEPAIGEIADCQCYDDESVSFEVGFFGNDVAGTITNISATAGVANNEYSLVDGVFTFTPCEADLQINGGVVEFTISLSVPGKTTATRQFRVTVKPAPPRFLGIAPGMVLLENYDSIGTDDTASLPAPWKVAHSDGDTPDYTLSYALAANTTTHRATNANGSISAFTNTGIYNLGTNDEDRAVGFVSGRSAYQTCALMVPVKNVSTETLSTLFVSYSVEKWRKGAGKRLALYTSMDGSAWTAVEGFETTTETDYSEGTTLDKAAYPLGEAIVIDTKAGKFLLSQPVAPQGTIYLGWFYTRPGSSGNGANGQCLGVDNVRIRFCGSDQTVIMMK